MIDFVCQNIHEKLFTQIFVKSELMDRLLIQENLDMELMPVPVLATSPTTGFMEFIENQSALAKALMKNQNDIRVFLLRNSSNLEASLQRYAKSCGNCILESHNVFPFKITKLQLNFFSVNV